MKRFLAWWNNFWFGPCDPLPVAVCRVGLGLLLTFYFVAQSTNWERFYGVDGVMSWCDADIAATVRPDWWCLFTWTEDWLPIRAYWAVGLAAAIALAVGWHTRVATAVLFAIILSTTHRNRLVVNGEELVCRMFLLYGLFSPWGEALSLDAWRKQRRFGKTLPPATQYAAWPVRLMQINFTLIYVISLPYKFAQDLDWLWGDALHWTVASDMWWIRGFLSEITLWWGGLFRKLLTWGTVFVEGTFPLLVCFRRTRLAATLAIMSMHLGIALLIPGVTLFTLSMVAGACLFVSPETYLAVAAWAKHPRWPALAWPHARLGTSVTGWLRPQSAAAAQSRA